MAPKKAQTLFAAEVTLGEPKKISVMPSPVKKKNEKIERPPTAPPAEEAPPTEKVWGLVVRNTDRETKVGSHS
jgi:hypothetical protein